MRQGHRIALRVIAVAVSLAFAGCFSRTVENVPAPAPVVQVTPPIVTPAPGTQTTTTTVRDNNVPAPEIAAPPATSQTTTTWDNGSVVQRNTVTEPRPGVVEKQTTTSWSDSASTPSETTTVTTTTKP
jgi:hypothetical protein